MKKYILPAVLLVSVFAVSGCVPANSKDLTQLRDEVSQMQINFSELQTRNADLSLKTDSATGNSDVLNETVKDIQNKILILTQKVQALENEIRNSQSAKIVDAYDLSAATNTAPNLAPAAPLAQVSPVSVYQTAYSDYARGKYDLSYQGFKSFIEKFPSSELAPQAQFYMGECMYSLKNWDRAVEEYKKVEKNYKLSDLTVTAKLKTALSYEALDKKSDALNIFALIVKDYPQSSEALTAREKIRAYSDVKKR
ncbi:tetratricopeptide repeat protein [Endomicrobium proavitum]|uniref:Putative lipoprotein n=1 Tax=Endomicrobium proavitum TaxID=1408281 RepID=A0A0G3WKV4_9BACT|nr:tetratricopeptide repeat protein [Endomicrobium proavitum]AKL98124.1 putative lipoprotein [Endomicrobium proavitum]